MIKLEHVILPSPEQMEFIIEGLRNPLNSWGKSDSEIYKDTELDSAPSFYIGDADHSLMQRLSDAGQEHRKYLRMMPVYVRITAPLYWWKEFDTYSVGVVPNPTDIVKNSCSTMHKIHDKEFMLEDFSTEHLSKVSLEYLERLLDHLNFVREVYNDDKSNKGAWWQLIQLLPSSYNQTRNVELNYEVLERMYNQRKNHKLDEWRAFCEWIKNLPYSEFMTHEHSDK